MLGQKSSAAWSNSSLAYIPMDALMVLNPQARWRLQPAAFSFIDVGLQITVRKWRHRRILWHSGYSPGKAFHPPWGFLEECCCPIFPSGCRKSCPRFTAPLNLSGFMALKMGFRLINHPPHAHADFGLL